jgi:hypothetical protein
MTQWPNDPVTQWLNELILRWCNNIIQWFNAHYVNMSICQYVSVSVIKEKYHYEKRQELWYENLKRQIVIEQDRYIYKYISIKIYRYMHMIKIRCNLIQFNTILYEFASWIDLIWFNLIWFDFERFKEMTKWWYWERRQFHDLVVYDGWLLMITSRVRIMNNMFSDTSIHPSINQSINLLTN